MQKSELVNHSIEAHGTAVPISQSRDRPSVFIDLQYTVYAVPQVLKIMKTSLHLKEQKPPFPLSTTQIHATPGCPTIILPLLIAVRKEGFS